MKVDCKISERGQSAVAIALIVALFIIVCGAAIIIIGPSIAKMFPGAMTISINKWPDKKPVMMIEEMDPSLLQGGLTPKCSVYVRATKLDGTGTIPGDGKFALLKVPDEYCDESKNVTFALGSIGYEPTPNAAAGGSYYDYTIVGLMPQMGVIPFHEGIVYDPDFDIRFKYEPNTPRSQIWKSYVGCMVNIVRSRDFSELLPCDTSGYYPVGEVMWQGAYGEPHDRVWIITVDAGRLKPYPISEYPELLPLLGKTFASEEFLQQAADILNSRPQDSFTLPLWNPIFPEINP